MKRGRCPLLLLATVALFPRAAWAQLRTWTDESGSFGVEAKFVELTAEGVRLEKNNGNLITVPLDRLNAADRQFVRQQADTAAAASSTTPATAPAPPPPTAGDALVEFQSGSKVEGRITARDEKSLTVETTRGGRTFSRRYPLDSILAISIDGHREVLGEPSAAGNGSGTLPGGSDSNGPAPLGVQRTSAQIENLIDRLGHTPPDWFDSVPLDYPRTLDLSWPQPPPGPWDAQKNVGQYVWDVINPNPGKWQSGVRFMHFMLGEHKNRPDQAARAMNSLGQMYFGLLQDYARAAFWFRLAGAERNPSPAGVKLAECYWKLGNKQMAIGLLGKLPTYYPTIKLLADMGETQQALRIAEAGARGGQPDLAYLYAGDACRVANRYSQALEYYGKVLDVPAVGKQAERIERNKTRARANIEGIKIFDTLDLSQVAEGTYRAESPGYAGQVEVEVVVAGGRIESVKVTKHKEKQFYSSITDTTAKIIEKQGVKGVDTTSGATITAEAIINGTAKALARGLK